MARVPYQSIPMPESNWSFNWGKRLVTELRQIFNKLVLLDAYAKAALPAATTVQPGTMVYVTDEAGGAVPAFSDGTNWRRVTDRNIVS